MFQKRYGGDTIDKRALEIRAIVNKISQKELLDFYSAFEQICGYHFDSPFVDTEFLKQKKNELSVGVGALMAGKTAPDRISATLEMFEEFISML